MNKLTPTQKILIRAITKAKKNGWDERILPIKTDADWNKWPLYVYDQQFARALWGNEIDVIPEDPYTRINWKYHLQNMIVSDDPIKYLDENL